MPGGSIATIPADQLTGPKSQLSVSSDRTSPCCSKSASAFSRPSLEVPAYSLSSCSPWSALSSSGASGRGSRSRRTSASSTCTEAVLSAPELPHPSGSTGAVPALPPNEATSLNHLALVQVGGALSATRDVGLQPKRATANRVNVVSRADPKPTWSSRSPPSLTAGPRSQETGEEKEALKPPSHSSRPRVCTGVCTARPIEAPPTRPTRITKRFRAQLRGLRWAAGGRGRSVARRSIFMTARCGRADSAVLAPYTRRTPPQRRLPAGSPRRPATPPRRSARRRRSVGLGSCPSSQSAAIPARGRPKRRSYMK